jgi:hypothetical protein
MAGGPDRARRAASQAAGPAAVREALAARFGTPSAERPRDWAARMGTGRDPPRSL